MLDSALEPSLVNYLTKLTTANVFVSALELSPASFSSAVSLALFLSLPVSRMLAQPTWKCSCLHSLFLSLSLARALSLYTCQPGRQAWQVWRTKGCPRQTWGTRRMMEEQKMDEFHALECSCQLSNAHAHVRGHIRGLRQVR